LTRIYSGADTFLILASVYLKESKDLAGILFIAFGFFFANGNTAVDLLPKLGVLNSTVS
jgi:hypothetical protein